MEVRLCLFYSIILVVTCSPFKPIVLFPGGAPGEVPGEVGPEGLLPDKGDNVTRLTNVTVPTITVMPPPSGTPNTGAAVLVAPGGAYGHLCMDLEGTDIIAWLNTEGITGVLLKYRVPRRKNKAMYWAPLQDAQRAMGILRARAAEFSIDPTKIGYIGFSAGGHLGAALSTNYKTRNYPKIDTSDAFSCRPNFTILIYPAYLVTNKDLTVLSPELNVTHETPLTFLTQAQDDPVHMECSLFYYYGLKKENVANNELHIFPAGHHGYGLRKCIGYEVCTWPQRAALWLEHHILHNNQTLK